MDELIVTTLCGSMKLNPLITKMVEKREMISYKNTEFSAF